MMSEVERQKIAKESKHVGETDKVVSGKMTSVVYPVELFKRLKHFAVEKGVSIRALTVEAVEFFLRQNNA